ncbi:hypothetical protein FVE85_6548 [Porphyridium purpureum]|uniref:Uncharacterized protein n=1 Tax=Porphyridium purpureum TaxID=35688 RepID=A0A5J4Z803_PORPP|nr:hypothetical protein FVE85_6548 [Porphyridium purpureum]|eukprot:POR8477..scf295_1
MARYSRVRCIGYVVSTTPPVGDESEAFDRDEWTSNPEQAIDDRFALFSAAVHQARDTMVGQEEPDCMYIFVVPEFFFRTPLGAMDSSDENWFGHLQSLVIQLASAPKFLHWLFVCGTILDSDALAQARETSYKAQQREHMSFLMRAYDNSADTEAREVLFSMLQNASESARQRSLYMVRNRVFIYKQNSVEFPKGLAVDKLHCSANNVRAIVFAPRVCSDLSVAYPPINLSNGEIKVSGADCRSIFTIERICFAVEVCLDHKRGRLRQVRCSHTASQVPVDVHLIVSCGMQIHESSVVARTGGIVFNTDGQYATREKDLFPDALTSHFQGSEDMRGHTQLSVVVEEAALDGTSHATLGLPERVSSVQRAPLVVPEGFCVNRIMAYGPGEIHLYPSLKLP